MRVMLDTSLWSSIRDEATENSLEELFKSRGLRIVVPPSTLMEVVRIPVAEARQQVIHALATGRRIYLPSEAEVECMEVVSELKRVRRDWMRAIPATGKVWTLNNYWTKKVWKEALRDSQRLHDYEMNQLRIRDYLIDHQRKKRSKFIKDHFEMGPVASLVATPFNDAPDSYLAGWAGEPIDFWRILLRDLLVSARRYHRPRGHYKGGYYDCRLDWRLCRYF